MGRSVIQISKGIFTIAVLAITMSLFVFACGKSSSQEKTSSNEFLPTEEPPIGKSAKKENVTPIEKAIPEKEKIEEESIGITKTELPDNKIEEVPQLQKVEAKPAKKAEPKIPKIFFQEKVYKFGDIDQGDTIVHSYMFVNSGNAPLYITDVDLSCGCTMSDYPKTAIKPRQAGYIELLFDSTHKEGSQRQYAIVSSNTIPGKDTLLLAGVVYRKIEDAEEDSISN